MIPLEEEDEKQTGDEKEEVEVEWPSTRDEEEKGEWQRTESGSEVIEQMDRKATSGVETQKARDETEARGTPDSDKLMERYIDQVAYSGEEEEQSEMDGGETECNLQNEAVEEMEESKGVERCRSSGEQRAEADECRSAIEGKTSLKHPEEDEGNDKNTKVTKMSESEDEEFERLDSKKENAGTSLQQTSILGKKLVPRCDQLHSEVRTVTFDPSSQALIFFRCLQT